MFNVTEDGYQAKIKNLLSEYDIHLHETKIHRENGNIKTYSFIIDVPVDIEEEFLISLIEYDCEISANL